MNGTTEAIGESDRVIVVGGGLAGLAAAAALADRGLPVTLLEARPRLGGRASSIVYRETGTTIDNCQHVTLGCCTNFRHFCDTLGLAGFFREEEALHFVGPPGAAGSGVDTLRAAIWPAPLHLLGGFRRLSYLDRDEKRALVRGLKMLARDRRSSDEGEAFDAWLARHGQPPNVVERFWFVVLVSALSESLDRISVKAARKVFVDGFLANRRGWVVSIPTVPLDDLYGERLTSWLAERGAVLRLGAGVERLELEGDRVTHVVLRGGERVSGTDFVVAVPHRRLPDLLPESLRDDPVVERLTRLETAPISSVHLWFDRPITDLPHAVLVERTSQWLFDRGDGTTAAGERARYYQVVISASRTERAISQETLIETVVAELREALPAAREAHLLHARRITEHDAVFSPLPGSDALRPPQQSPIPNLQFAGDWTRTGWPATMEGAVRSGYLAAENVLSRRGRATTVLQPNLPTSLMSRWGLGIEST